MRNLIIHLLGGYTEEEVVTTGDLFFPPDYDDIRSDLIELTTEHENDGHVKISAVRRLVSKYTPQALKG